MANGQRYALAVCHDIIINMDDKEKKYKIFIIAAIVIFLLGYLFQIVVFDPAAERRREVYREMMISEGIIEDVR